MKHKNIERAVKALLKAGKLPKHGRPKDPTKKDLERKFTIRVDRKGRPMIKELR